VRAALVTAAARQEHPVGAAARRYLLVARDRSDPGDRAAVDAVCAAAAAEPAGPLAGFCRQHRLAPADPRTRAMFFLLTGQPAEHAAADPDGRLLAAGYATAGPATQARLRAAMVASDLDLVRVVVGERPDRAALVSPAELEYVATQLVVRRDWPGLWRLLVDVSPVRALELVRRFPAGWQPAGDPDRQLCAALRATPPDVVRAATVPAAARCGMLVGTGTIGTVAFAADESAVTVVREHGGSRRSARSSIGIYTVPALRLLIRRTLTDPLAADAAALQVGDATVLAVGRGQPRHGRLILRSPTGPATLRYGLAELSGPVPLPSGYAVASWPELLFGGADGRLVRQLPLTGLGVGWLDVGPGSLVSEPTTGRLALGGNRLLVLAPDGTPIANAVSSPAARAGLGRDTVQVAFTGPGQLVTYGQRARSVIAWRLYPRGLVPTAELPAPAPARLAAFPAHGLVALNGSTWCAAGTLAEVPGPRSLELVEGTRLVASPSGDWALVVAGSAATVVRIEPAAWAIELAERPVSAAGVVDLTRVLAAERAALTPAARRLLGLLRACLEPRFGSDIEVATGGGPIGADYDIDVGLTGAPGWIGSAGPAAPDPVGPHRTAERDDPA